ncbi:FadR/GntR family transcriptional regulator [Candidatus Thiodiazotropha sp. CDECU1]|uniref:FadR/GntR family transcriptional regulator n=1 Tax=Candidatus Thiodiazotropha sp. CDECU1 TaxID=3065865 RepID=UPI00292EEDA9|nr:FadR/GntR family transcriptional regulator [Candidatus Thiodiazotropha sp. CDECU1]
MQEQAIIKSSISKQIAEQLRAAIVSGRFKSGERLPTEDELATRYGVSRATVREALKRLAAQNLVRSKRGPAGGNFVNQPTHAELAESLSGAATLLVGLGALDIDEIIEARRLLQGSCLKLASTSATLTQIKEVESALLQQKNLSLSDKAFCDADVAFHRALVDASGNGMVRFVMYTIIEALVPITNMVVAYVKDRREIIAFHEALLSALKQRDQHMLATVLDNLLDYLHERFSVAKAQHEQKSR